MELVLVSLIAGLVPMLVYAAMLWWIDHWEREPLWLVMGAFLWGAVPAVIASLVFQLATSAALFGALPDGNPNDPHLAFVAVVVAPLTEEFCKGFLLLVIFLFFRREINSLMDGLVYGAMIGFGFAAVENVGYFISFGSQNPSVLLPLIALRAFAFGPIHAFFTGLTGLAFAFARFQKNWALKLLAPPLGLAAAMSFHALHNLCSVEPTGVGIVAALVIDWFGLFWIFVLLAVSIYQQRQWIVRGLEGEVALGVLPQAQAVEAASFGHLALHGLFPFLYWLPHGTAQRRLAKLSARLAFKKRELERMGEERGNQAAVAQLRAAVWEASQQLMQS